MKGLRLHGNCSCCRNHSLRDAYTEVKEAEGGCGLELCNGAWLWGVSWSRSPQMGSVVVYSAAFSLPSSAHQGSGSLPT